MVVIDAKLMLIPKANLIVIVSQDDVAKIKCKNFLSFDRVIVV